MSEGDHVGLWDGLTEGAAVGVEGETLGLALGLALGDVDGDVLGDCVGAFVVGDAEGDADGLSDGGTAEGAVVTMLGDGVGGFLATAVRASKMAKATAIPLIRSGERIVFVERKRLKGLALLGQLIKRTTW